jgi:hypothetical protein
MSKFNAMRKPFLACALALGLLASAAVFSAAGADNYAAVAAQTLYNDAQFSALGTNLIKYKRPKLTQGEMVQEASNNVNAYLGGMTNGVLGVTDTTECTTLTAARIFPDAVTTATLTWELDAATSVEKIVVNTRNYAASAQTISKYEVYLSATEAGLFDEGNKYYTYEPASWEALQTLTANPGGAVSAKFFGLKLFKSTGAETKVMEIGVFGTPTAGDYASLSEERTLTDDQTAALGTSLIGGKKPKIIVNSAVTTGITLMENITDGKTSTARTISTGFFASGAPTEFVYTLDAVSIIEKIAVYTGAYGTVSQVLDKYEVYLSEAEGDLFSPENKIFTYDPGCWMTLQTVTVAGKASAAKFFGFRIFPSGSANAPNLCELGVYGTPLTGSLPALEYATIRMEEETKQDLRFYTELSAPAGWYVSEYGAVFMPRTLFDGLSSEEKAKGLVKGLEGSVTASSGAVSQGAAPAEFWARLNNSAASSVNCSLRVLARSYAVYTNIANPAVSAEPVYSTNTSVSQNPGGVLDDYPNLKDTTNGAATRSVYSVARTIAAYILENQVAINAFADLNSFTALQGTDKLPTTTSLADLKAMNGLTNSDVLAFVALNKVTAAAYLAAQF